MFNNPFFFNPWVLAALTAFGGSLWPILARASGAHHGLVMIIAYGGSAFVGLLLRPTFTVSSAWSIVLLGAVSVIAHLNSFFYTRMSQLSTISQAPPSELSNMMAMNAALYAMFGFLGSAIILGESVWDLRKILGIITAVITVILLKH